MHSTYPLCRMQIGSTGNQFSVRTLPSSIAEDKLANASGSVIPDSESDADAAERGNFQRTWISGLTSNNALNPFANSLSMAGENCAIVPRLTSTVGRCTSQRARSGCSSATGAQGRRIGPQRVNLLGTWQGNSHSGRPGRRQARTFLSFDLMIMSGIGPGTPWVLRYLSTSFSCGQVFNVDSSRKARMVLGRISRHGRG